MKTTEPNEIEMKGTTELRKQWNSQEQNGNTRIKTKTQNHDGTSVKLSVLTKLASKQSFAKRPTNQQTKKQTPTNQQTNTNKQAKKQTTVTN